MENFNVAPVDHGILSSTGTVAAGTAGGGIKAGIKGYGWTVLACAGIGAAIGVFGLGFLLSGALLGAVAGGVLGAWAIAPAVGIISGAIGAAKGAGRAANQVKLEKGAANVMQAQVEAYKAQAYVNAANDNRYNFPPQGSNLNPAGTTVNNVVLADRVNGQQMQRA